MKLEESLYMEIMAQYLYGSQSLAVNLTLSFLGGKAKRETRSLAWLMVSLKIPPGQFLWRIPESHLWVFIRRPSVMGGQAGCLRFGPEPHRESSCCGPIPPINLGICGHESEVSSSARCQSCWPPQTLKTGCWVTSCRPAASWLMCPSQWEAHGQVSLPLFQKCGLLAEKY